MTFKDYIINYNAQFVETPEKMIDVCSVDLSEEELALELMNKYVEMLREKIRRKMIVNDESTFILSGTREVERYMYDSIAAAYIYENQYERKELQSKIAELINLSMEQVKAIAVKHIGEMEGVTEEEKKEAAKLLIADSVEETERSI